MAPGVPFVPLAGVQLVAIAADLGLAVVALNPRWRRRSTPLLVAACVALAIVDGLTAIRFGDSTGDALTWVRALAHLGLVVGVATRALGGSRLKSVASTAGAGAVVVPLGAAPQPAAAAAATALLAGAVALLRLRGTDVWWARLLAAGFLGLAVAAALEPGARDSGAAALAVLVARGAGSFVLLLALARVARSSLLAQVVGASLVGVLLMAIGAVGVGGVVASSVQNQQERSLGRIAAGQVAQIQDEVPTVASLAAVVAACPDRPAYCLQVLGSIGVLTDDFYAVINRDGSIASSSKLTASERVSLRGLPLVARALNPQIPTDRQPGGTVAPFGTGVAVVGVAAPDTSKPAFVAVYGGRLGPGFASNAKKQSQYDVTVLAGGKVVASTLSTADVALVASDPQAREITTRAAPSGRVVSVTALGDRPTIAYAVITAPDDVLPLAVLAVSQPAELALQAERRAFTEVFATALVVLLLVALVAWLLGRRLVRPVRQLTVVAAQVRRGDFSARAELQGQDEVGRLGRAMDAMTASLAQSTADLRTAAEEQQAISARLGAVLDSMTEALVVVEADGTVGQANPAAGELLGVPAGSLVGQPAAQALAVSDAAGSVVDLRPGAFGEGSLTRPDGRVIPVAFSSAALAGRTGAVVLLRDTSRDREVERMKTEFLSNVSHELRTPLTPIRGYAEILRRPRGVTEAQRENYLGTIADSAVRMSRIVDLIVDVAAIDAGRVSWEPRPVPVGAWVDERLDLWRKRVPDRAGDLRRRVAARLPELLVDPVWLGKAVDELMDNAIKHSPTGTPVTLFAVASPVAGRVRLGVKDAGQGVDPEALPELFADFRQVDGSATRRVGGLGLGLSFVRRIADAQGMGLVVTSTPRKGAEFGLDVPASARRPARGAGNRRRPG